MNIFITGVAGFIGSNLSRALLKRGHTVCGIDNFLTGKKENLHPDVLFWKNDVTTYYIHAKHILEQKFDVIFHLATRKIPRYGNADKCLLDNINGIVGVYHHAKQCGARLIMSSTSDVYGKQSDFSETADSIIGSPVNCHRWAYAVSKLWQENFLFSQNNLDFVIARIFGSYGPFMAQSWTAGPPFIFIDKAYQQNAIPLHYDGLQTRCFAYIDDIVNGLILLMERGVSRGIYNIGDPRDEITIKQFGALIWRLINGTDVPCKYSYSLPSQQPYEDVVRRKPDIGKILGLGFILQYLLEEGLAKTIAWYKTL